MNNGSIITGANPIGLARMYALKGALKLEMQGLSRRGKSACAIIKKEFNLSGNRKRILDDFLKIISETEERVGVVRDRAKR